MSGGERKVATEGNEKSDQGTGPLAVLWVKLRLLSRPIYFHCSFLDVTRLGMACSLHIFESIPVVEEGKR